MPYGYYAMVCSRSGLAAKSSVFVLNAPGIIDADYKDTLKVIIHNGGHRPFVCKQGDRIAQLVFMPTVQVANALKPAKERSGGLGSTGT
jgi:dUTP pyrophosphatase